MKLGGDGSYEEGNSDEEAEEKTMCPLVLSSSKCCTVYTIRAEKKIFSVLLMLITIVSPIRCKLSRRDACKGSFSFFII